MRVRATEGKRNPRCCPMSRDRPERRRVLRSSLERLGLSRSDRAAGRVSADAVRRGRRHIGHDRIGPGAEACWGGAELTLGTAEIEFELDVREQVIVAGRRHRVVGGREVR